MNLEEAKQNFCSPIDERALLCFSIKDINNFYSISSKLDVSDFLYPEHPILFTVIGALIERGASKIDLPMIADELNRSAALEIAGGYNYLVSINNMSVSEDNINVYLSKVLESSTKFKLYCTLNDNLNFMISDNDLDSTSLIGKVEGSILDLSTKSKSITEPVDLADGLQELIDTRKKEVKKQSGISTGFPIFDKQLDGMVDGTLMVISARKKMGKSSLLTNIAIHVAYRLGIPVLYVDTEMSFDQWRNRAVSILSGVNERDIIHGGYNEEQYGDIVRKCVKVVEKGKLFHETMPGYSVDKLVALYKKYKYKHNIGLMIFDYLKEPDLSTVERGRKEYQILGDVTTALKNLSVELNIPALTAVQINRSNDIADSDKIARYADVVAQWMRKTEEELRSGGHRGGTHKMVIRDTRRGGLTSEEGIGYYFFKEVLTVKEVPPAYQLIKSFSNDEVMNYDGANLKEFGDDQLQ